MEVGHNNQRTQRLSQKSNPRKTMTLDLLVLLVCRMPPPPPTLQMMGPMYMIHVYGTSPLPPFRLLMNSANTALSTTSLHVC